MTKEVNFLHADREDSEVAGRMMRLICVFAGSNLKSLDFSHSASNIKIAESSNGVSIIMQIRKIKCFLNFTARHVYKHTSLGCQNPRMNLYFVYVAFTPTPIPPRFESWSLS